MQYILRGIANGFHIGFDHHCPLRQPSYTMLTQNPSIISEYLHREASLGRMQCLPPESINKGVHISPIGAIPKKHKPGKWRLIVDLSSPSNAPKIFSAVADALQWILIQKGVRTVLHYLDDFIIVARSWSEANYQREILVSTCHALGVPLEPSKLEGPATCLSFLGIEFDTMAFQLRLPTDKLVRLKAELNTAISRKCMKKHNLQSLTGLLQHATKVIRPGRPFLRRLHALQSVGSFPHHQIRLNIAARADIIWWHTFVDTWNGLSLLWSAGICSPDTIVVSDASGSWGCGAYYLPHWFHMKWPPQAQHFSITVKELFPVVIAAAIFGRYWSGQLIQFSVDNEAVVHVPQATYSHESHLMHLIRILVFLASHFNFWFTASHIAGDSNILADALSRNNADLFLSQVPRALQHSSRIPPPLIDLLICNITWTSTVWTKLFKDILQQL